MLSSLTVTPLSYSDNLISHYQALSDLPGFVLLESSDRERGRYDILSALPYDVFKILRNNTDLNSVLAQLQQRLTVVDSVEDWPFQGGAIGYFSYDFATALAGISSVPHPCNDMPLIDIGFYDWAIIADHKKKVVNLVAANRQKETRAKCIEILDRWYLAKPQTKPFVMHPFKPLIKKKDYKLAFESIYQDLMDGRSYQVNYTQPFLGEYSGDVWEIYKEVSSKNPVPYSAFLRAEEGDILSFSPEHFISMENGKIVTSPIKGTSKRSENPLIDEQLRSSLMGSAKNRAENVMIVDLLRNDFGKIAKAGSIHVSSLCELQSFKGVHHLVSTIEAECDSTITPIDLFSACFPGGSITGAPKREAMRIISEHEPYARGVYCGSIAYFSAHGRFDSNIAIRTITAKQNTMYLSAGGGIVIDSNWEDEYRESYTKIEAIVHELNSSFK